MHVQAGLTYLTFWSRHSTHFLLFFIVRWVGDKVMGGHISPHIVIYTRKIRIKLWTSPHLMLQFYFVL